MAIEGDRAHLQIGTEALVHNQVWRRISISLCKDNKTKPSIP